MPDLINQNRYQGGPQLMLKGVLCIMRERRGLITEEHASGGGHKSLKKVCFTTGAPAKTVHDSNQKSEYLLSNQLDFLAKKKTYWRLKS